MQLTTIATCYMPVIRDGEEIQHRFEEGDVVEVPDDKVKSFLKTGNFAHATTPSDNPIYVEEPEEEPVDTEDSEDSEED